MKATFNGTEINVTSEGKRYVGAAVGTRLYLTEYVTDKVDEWVQKVVNLAEFATTQTASKLYVHLWPQTSVEHTFYEKKMPLPNIFSPH